MHIDLRVVIGLLVAAVAVAIAAKRARIPYNVALVVGGMLLALGNVFPQMPRLEPHFVFLICLPVLLFEGGITADFRSIKANLFPIVMLATVGMGLAVFVTGAAVHTVLGYAWGPALLMGCMLAVTDTVSILFAFRRAPVPGRLAGIIQGESLFNDGTALVLFAALVGVVTAGGDAAIAAVTAKVVLVSVSGLAVGLAVGLLGAMVIRWTRDPLAEIMATTALAYASYALAEEFHASGVIAAVTAGLVVGTTLRRDLMPQSQVAIHSFWEYVAFGVNTFLFLSVGLSTDPRSLYDNLPAILAAMGCLIVGRAAGVYVPFLLIRGIRPAEAIPLRWQHVFLTGNIKGALSIALALSLPESTPMRDVLVNVVFGVTFLSLTVQGLSLPWTMRKLGLVSEDAYLKEVSAQQGALIGARAAQRELDELIAAGLVSRTDFERLRSVYQTRIAAAERELRRLQDKHLTEGARSLLATRRRLVDAERAGIAKAVRGGLLPEDAGEHLGAALDRDIMNIEHALSSGTSHGKETGR